jgi:hypothetical protein
MCGSGPRGGRSQASVLCTLRVARVFRVVVMPAVAIVLTKDSLAVLDHSQIDALIGALKNTPMNRCSSKSTRSLIATIVRSTRSTVVEVRTAATAARNADSKASGSSGSGISGRRQLATHRVVRTPIEDEKGHEEMRLGNSPLKLTPGVFWSSPPNRFCGLVLGDFASWREPIFFYRQRDY